MLRSLRDWWGDSLAGRTMLVVALGYLGAAELGHLVSLKTADQTFATFWPAAGVLLAALVLTPYRRWPGVLAAALAANLVSDVLLHDKTVLVGLGFFAANGGEGCLGAWLLRRLAGPPFAMARIREVLGLAGAALIGPLLGATVGAWVVALAYQAPYGPSWQVWWSADALGIMVAAPAVLAWSARRVAGFREVRTRTMVEGGAVIVAVLLAVEAVFGEWLPRGLALPMFLLPLLLWAAVRLGPEGAALAVLGTSLVAVWNTAEGRGHYTFLAPTPLAQIARAQTGMAVFSASILFLAATVAERRQAEKQRIKLIGELERALSEIKTLRGLIPICAWCKKIRDDQGLWRRLEDYLRDHTDAKLTHGICSECEKKFFPEYQDEGSRKDEGGGTKAEG